VFIRCVRVCVERVCVGFQVAGSRAAAALGKQRAQTSTRANTLCSPDCSERFAQGDKSCDAEIIPQISGYCLCEGNITTARCALGCSFCGGGAAGVGGCMECSGRGSCNGKQQQKQQQQPVTGASAAAGATASSSSIDRGNSQQHVHQDSNRSSI